jgi:trehalose 6-phosphate phosphatase
MAVEIYPNVPWNKGCAVQLIRCRIGLDSARCVVFGDDETDESMFRRLSEEVTVRVGQNDLSSARYHLRDSGEVQIALEFLADFMRPEEFHCDHLRRPFTAESAWMRRA